MLAQSDNWETMWVGWWGGWWGDWWVGQLNVSRCVCRSVSCPNWLRYSDTFIKNLKPNPNPQIFLQIRPNLSAYKILRSVKTLCLTADCFYALGKKTKSTKTKIAVFQQNRPEPNRKCKSWNSNGPMIKCTFQIRYFTLNVFKLYSCNSAGCAALAGQHRIHILYYIEVSHS